jgi:hypothetical protein
VKAKTIKAVLRKKMDEWLDSIEDDALRTRVKNHTIITGGCIASMLLREPVNDFDVYFTDYETALAVANYYVGKFKAAPNKGIPIALFVSDGTDKYAADDLAKDGEKRIRIIAKSSGVAGEEKEGEPAREYQYFESRPDNETEAYVSGVIQDPADVEDAVEDIKDKLPTEEDGKPKYRPVFLSTNAITLSHKVQIVLRFYGDADKIHENFDFAHCTSYWTSKDSELVLRPAALEALITKELRYIGSKYPVCSMIRVRKFLQRGWTINAGQIVKMAMQVSALDLTDVKVLQDQLTGVDVAYFCQLIERVKEKNPDKVNSAYVIEIIDRMF